jgi:5-methyltetrahydrofolate--homocysteine methyltransferase
MKHTGILSKKDWNWGGIDMNEAKLNRHRRFWQPLAKGEGAYIAVQAPIDDTGSLPCPFRPPASKEENVLGVDYCVQKAEAAEANTYFGGDAIHSRFVNFGPGVQAAFFGAPYTITKDSVWFDLNPPIKNWDTIPDFTMNREHELFKAIEAQTRALCAASGGRYGVSYTDIGGQYDILFSLRGEDLLMDMLEYPEIILTAEDKLDDAFIEYFNFLTGIIGPSGCGYTNWIPIMNDKPWYPIQCDLSVMLSPKQFEKFVLPALDKVGTAIGQTVYHLDGPEEIRHLDMLLSMKHVHAIQWVPLPTHRLPDGSYIQNFADEMSLDVYRRSLKAGRKVIIYGTRPEQLQGIFDAVGTDGIFVQTWCGTRKDADALINCAEKNWIR